MQALTDSPDTSGWENPETFPWVSSVIATSLSALSGDPYRVVRQLLRSHAIEYLPNWWLLFFMGPEFKSARFITPILIDG
jgi:hypothetical protein